MSALEIDDVCATRGGVAVVHDVSLSVATRGFCVVMGPSGCGKTSLLRLVAGLDVPTRGRIRIGGVDVTRHPPQDREIGVVFQGFALYPHMTARENLTYGLRVRKVPALEIARRLERIVEMTGLADLLERTPERLSGGQQQRVALGRALMREPAVLLFDEPLSNLDAKLRAEMRAELGRLHRETGSTALYVTHDPVEALSLADTLVIMRNGRVEQQGRPRDVYGSPANVFVAQFLGHPGVSLLNATVGDGAEVCLSNGSVVGHAPGIQGRVLVGIRPQHVRIGAGHLSGVTVQVEDHGPFRLVTIDADGFRVTTLESESTIAVGAAVKFEIAWQHGVLFHGEGLQRIDGFRGSTCSAASSRA